jgi:hypothetical protein
MRDLICIISHLLLKLTCEPGTAPVCQ